MPHSRDVIVVTSCTNRKKKAGRPLVLGGFNSADSVRRLAAEWKRRVQEADDDKLHAAIRLYCGRSISEAKQAADALDAPLYIASAGHGLLHADDRVPSYNVTVSPTSDNGLHQFLIRLGKTPSDWWQALIEQFGQQRSLSALASKCSTATLLLAVPSSYLTLLHDELTKLRDSELNRLRIITSPLGASVLPARLQRTVMPYDERLEGLPTRAGTRADFPQRALRHFVVDLQAHGLPLNAARARVEQALMGLRKPVLPERARKTDEEIISLLLQNWERFDGSATALLRFLRDEVQVACEQSRFRHLRRKILSDLESVTTSYG